MSFKMLGLEAGKISSNKVSFEHVAILHKDHGKCVLSFNFIFLEFFEVLYNCSSVGLCLLFLKGFQYKILKSILKISKSEERK